ncbi:MAG: dTDP-4-dehydrorhamnose 3,5-epimerase [Bacteroidales bacterium]|nr:dTDP-4-dehydrorhamnose 3,5-epimerase [Bacteroidales bacterium]
MTVTDTFIKDLKIIEPKVFGDQRGYFFETWKKSDFEAAGINFIPVQQNESSSTYGVVRGLHFQLNPYSQAKLVRCVVGKVLDVAVDVRKGSPTFGKHFSVELSEENKRQFFIPRGFAHGFSVLSDYAVFSYLCDNVYNKESEGGIIFNDPELGIDWKIPQDKMILSDKDTKHPALKNAILNF